MPLHWVNYASTTLEAVQVLIASFSAVVTILGLRDAIVTYRTIHDAGFRNGRIVIASGHIRSEIYRLLAQLGLLVVALVSLWLPPPELVMTDAAVIAALWHRKALVLMVGCLLLAQTVSDFYERRTLRVLYDNKL